MNKTELLEELEAEKRLLEALKEEKTKAEEKVMFLEPPIYTTEQNIQSLESELSSVNFDTILE